MKHHQLFVVWMLTDVCCSIVSAGGVFELRLLSFVNPSNRDAAGACCASADGSTPQSQPRAVTTTACSTPCTPSVRVCLKEYQSQVNAAPPCAYGSRLLDAFNNTHVDFPFDFTWPGGFTLIIEVWHHRPSAAAIVDTPGSDQLLLRLAETRRIRMGAQWTAETVASADASSRMRFQYRVQCDQHYYGQDCSTYCREGLGNANYVCGADGSRQCKVGWMGPRCQQAVCAPGCDHGSCTRPGTCDCQSGWEGAKCDRCQKYPGCEHGSCDGEAFACKCAEGWGGLFCNLDLNYCTHHQPCKNGATCTNTGAGYYTCACQPGWTGVDCETKVVSCAQTPCLNDGQCSTTSNGDYACSCRDGFSGRHCEMTDITCAHAPCQHGATCVPTAHGFKCVCPAAYTGSLCQQRVDPCQAQPCHNGGRCLRKQDGFHCECPREFGGPTCADTLDFCSEHLPCLNGGTCETDQISQFRCRCPPGFYGKLCQKQLDACEQRPCANGGSCAAASANAQGYRCHCPPGFTGRTCSVEINECASNPCRNGGHCVDLLASYRCECRLCFGGSRCQQRDDDCLQATNRTLSYVAGPSSHASLQRTLLLVGLPVIALFTVIIVGLALFVVVLYRRTYSTAGQTSVDTASRENHLNALREQQLNQYAEYQKPTAKSLLHAKHDTRHTSDDTIYSTLDASPRAGPMPDRQYCQQLPTASPQARVPLPRRGPPSSPPAGFTTTSCSPTGPTHGPTPVHHGCSRPASSCTADHQQQRSNGGLHVLLPDRRQQPDPAAPAASATMSPATSSGSTCSTNVLSSPEDPGDTRSPGSASALSGGSQRSSYI